MARERQPPTNAQLLTPGMGGRLTLRFRLKAEDEAADADAPRKYQPLLDLSLYLTHYQALPVRGPSFADWMVATVAGQARRIMTIVAIIDSYEYGRVARQAQRKGLTVEVLDGTPGHLPVDQQEQASNGDLLREVIAHAFTQMPRPANATIYQTYCAQAQANDFKPFGRVTFYKYLKEQEQ